MTVMVNMALHLPWKHFFYVYIIFAAQISKGRLMPDRGIEYHRKYYLQERTTTTTTTPLPTTTVSYEPYFDQSAPHNVASPEGRSTAYLICRVKNLGNKTVSWIRHRDIHILTVGLYTYTSDMRFGSSHDHEHDEWVLSIKWPQQRDAGVYECQVSSQPIKSYFVTLEVVAFADVEQVADSPTTRCFPSSVGPVPKAVVLGGPDMYVDKGSTINLTCVIYAKSDPPAYLFWYHEDEIINYDSPRGGVTVITEKGDITVSVLLIQRAKPSDSGKYSCAPSNADVASIKVHVLNEKPAAMQTGSAGLFSKSESLTFVILLVQVSCFSIFHYLCIEILLYVR